MVFNWFRRQFGSEEGASEKTKPETQSPVEQEQEAPAETAESEPTPESATTVDEDYLSWAKAAYKNIQQQASPESPEITSPEESTVAETEVTTPPVTDEEEPEDAVTSTDTTAT
ncbi:MAG: signal recognition particle-docking protein FtsY, partial [Symploca sp. SIO3E6]|nr:signal recognition particle-docking protein FtsY [Caldora sp. SIO3E6]